MMSSTDFKTLSELAGSIEEKSRRIQNGEYGLEEVESALKEIKELQERLIVLKYKALERMSKNTTEFDEEPLAEIEELEDKEEAESMDDQTKVSQMTIMDGIKQEEASINEKLFTDEKSLAQKLEEGAIDDLRKAISLNDKFTFIRQLFDEDHAAYEEVIKKLDNASDFDEATVTINEVMVEFSWEEENDAVQKFRDLINRKFG